MLAAEVKSARPRLLSHLTIDQARNEPGIDRFTSVAVVDAVLLDHRRLPIGLVSAGYFAVGCLGDFDPSSRPGVLEHVTLADLRKRHLFYGMFRTHCAPESS